MAYSSNILPKSAAYYNLNRANIVNSELLIEAGGYAEIQISTQMLQMLTKKMLVVAHPSVFSDYYTNNAVQITLSIVTEKGECVEYLIPVSEEASGVFNTEVTLPEGYYQSFKYRISSAVEVSIYNWELCAEEDTATSIVIGGVEQALPRLLYDFNTYAYAVAQKELTVGLITCYLLDDTDLQGHFTISFFATEKCNVHVRIKDNGITELFSPQVYTVERGYASISIAHAYLKKLAVDHAFSVTIQCTNGKLSIPVRGMLYTIDGGYLADRLLDAGIDVQDITIKQTPEDYSPSEIWAIGFEGNRLLIKSREYSQRTRANWTAIKDLGEASIGAIEFYARWTLRYSVDKYTMETEELPHAFAVDTEGNLKTYFGETFDEFLLLDTNVTDVSACQGFSSMLFIEQDQGLIVAYIKGGNVYYRQYAYNEDIGGPMWYPIETLYEEGDAIHVSVHRLPDYRTGICVQHASDTKWYITERMYVGQAAKPEIANISASPFNVATVIDASRANEKFGLATTSYTYAFINESISENMYTDKYGIKHLIDEEKLAEEIYFNVFKMKFEDNLLFLNGKTLNDLVSTMHVYINGTEVKNVYKGKTIVPGTYSEVTDVYLNIIRHVEIVNNELIVTLNKYIRLGNKIQITFDLLEFVVKIYNGCFCKAHQDYSWDLPVPLSYVSNRQSVSLSVSPTLSIDMHEIISNNVKQKEEIGLGVDLDLNCMARVITTHAIKQKELLDLSVNTELSLKVTQVGTSPI